MKRIRKKFLGLCSIVLFVPGLLAGCSKQPDIQPAEHLQSMIEIITTYDMEKWQEIAGDKELFTGAGDEESQEFMKELWRTMLQNVDVTCTCKESDGSTAVVEIRGKTGNLSSITQKVFEEVAQEGKPWAQSYKDRNAVPTQQEIQDKIMELTLENFEEYAGQMEIENVDIAITMHKQENGYWWVTKDDTQEMQFLLFGSTDIKNDPGLQNMGIDLNVNFVG